MLRPRSPSTDKAAAPKVGRNMLPSTSFMQKSAHKHSVEQVERPRTAEGSCCVTELSLQSKDTEKTFVQAAIR